MKNCTYLFRTLLLVCVLSVFQGTASAQVPAPFTQEHINASTGDYLGFLQYKPADYNQQPNTKYPLIIFLHGIGERGNGTSQLRNVTCCGLPRIIKLGHKMKFTWNGKTESFVVIAPQCPTKYGMWPTQFVDELIKYAKQNLHIDADRIFLTGLSMGGGGSLRYISNDAAYPKNLAACATICAPCTFYDGKVVADAKLPVWSFHAVDDPTASVACSHRAFDRIMAANPEVKPLLTLWPTGGHQVWDRVYTDTSYKYQGVVNIYEWFLGQNRKLAPNKLPVAHAGGNINITTGTGTATLDASSSTDADGKIVRYVWKKLSGPDAGTITNSFGSNSTTTVTDLNVPGIYTYAVYVVDDRAAFTSDTITVTVAAGSTVPNVLPVAKAGTDVNLTLPENNTTLDGSNSTDADGSIISYYWSKVSGPAANISDPNKKTTNVLSLVAGTYVFKLKVIDDKGGSSEDQITVNVKAIPPPVNKLPVAKAGNDLTITLPNNKITLNGNGSSDPDGTISSYSWTKITGPNQYVIANPNSANTDVTKLTEGTYAFKLRVTDNKGAVDADTIMVTVNPAPPPLNIPPVAEAGANKTVTLPIDSVRVFGDQSTDADGSVTNYTWTYISGPSTYTIKNANNANTDITGLVAGTYTFRLLVKDNNGATDADTIVVKVNQAIVPPPPPNVAPVAKTGNTLTITLPENSVTVNGSASTDADGTITNYTWIKISGPNDFNIVNPSSSITDINNLSQGTYYFRLQVKDNDGAIGRDTVKVIVNPAPNAIPNADAGADIEVQLPNPTIQLDGRASNDPDGTIASYD
ncbi:MAG: PKD domain-containing protein, partial [Flavitalea sp.]